jgi:hypothetical protein
MTISRNYQLQFNSRNTANSDVVLEVNVSWENPINDAVIADRINAWLVAIGAGLEVVERTKQ